MLAQFGLIDLIARGYGTLTWLFLAVFVVPVLTRGVWKVVRSTAESAAVGTDATPDRPAASAPAGGEPTGP